MKTKSFTLIELLVVIVIIGILAGVIIVSTSSSIGKANIAKVKVFENSVLNELGANMVSRWKLDEVIGTTTTPDAWGNNTGTLGDGVTASTYPTLKDESECVSGKCMYFDGTNDYIEVNNNSNLKNKDFTASLWFNSSALSSNKYLIGNGSDYNSARGFGILTCNSNLRFQIGVNTISVTNIISTPVEINKWYFVTAIYKEGVGSKLYLNGNLKEIANSYIGSIIYDTKIFTIGKLRDNYYFFNGSIDDVRIYNSALSTSQIKQEYIAGLNSLLANNNISKEEYDQRLNSLSFK